MTETSSTAVVVAPAPTRTRDIIALIVPLIALAITVATLLYGSGRLAGQINDNTRRITLLEARADRRDDEQSEIKASIAGIDAKLDLLIKRTPSDRP